MTGSNGFAPKRVFKRGEKLEINPLLLQAFGITAEDLAETIRTAEEPEAMGDMFAFLSDYATLSDPGTRLSISGDRLDFMVADIRRRMPAVAEFYKYHAKTSGDVEEEERLLKFEGKAEQLSRPVGNTRLDKVAYIDAVMNFQHTSGFIVPLLFGISDYGREDYWPRKLLAFLRTHGMPGVVQENTVSDKGFNKEGLSMMVREEANNGFRANPELVNKQAARVAYAGTSFEPEKRGEQAIRGFAEEVQAIYERLKSHARTDAEKALLLSEMERFQTAYAQKYNDLLYSHSRIYSTMIAGPSGFPAERMRKINEAYDKKAQETREWVDRAERAMLRALKGLATEEAGGEVAVLKKKIEQAEMMQEAMKFANAVLRKKIPDIEKMAEIIKATGWSEDTVRKLFVPDYMGRIGFPAFELTNNSANIRRMKERLVELEKREVTPTGEITFTGGRIVDNREADRVQIYFDQRPSQEMINKLKSEGWRWSPANVAWQRKRTDAAMISARRITGAAQPAVPAAQPPAPAVQPIAVPPIPKPQPYALPELRWVYGTVSNRWHLVGPEDRDWVHGINQQRMKQIGPEAARAEYLSPALARAGVVPSLAVLAPQPPAVPHRPAEEIMFVANPETMTKAEFVEEKYKRMAQVLRQQGKDVIAIRIEKGTRDPEWTFKFETSHRDQVVLALAEGKTVPPHVLKDYPDIVERIRVQAPVAPAAVVPVKPLPSPVSQAPAVAVKVPWPAEKPAPRKFVQKTFMVEERVRRNGYGGYGRYGYA